MSCDGDRCLAQPDGHPDWLDLHGELLYVHQLKSGGYGTKRDLFRNFTVLAEIKGQPRFVYAIDRAQEKMVRLYSLIEQGRLDELEEEFKDIAALMLCAGAMRREDVRERA